MGQVHNGKLKKYDRPTGVTQYVLRQENPDYVVLSKFLYSHFLIPTATNMAEARVIADFFQGRTDYTLVATFETPTFVPIDDFPINQRIAIFAYCCPHQATGQATGLGH